MSFLRAYVKHKGIETAFLQLLNLVVPLSGVATQVGLDVTADILVPMLKSYALETEQ